MAGVNEQDQAMVKMVGGFMGPWYQCNTPNRFGLQMQAGMESCPVKTVISGTMGFGLGGAFGLFMASVSSFLFQMFTYSE